MDEMWKDIGESIYQVSTLGNVRNRKSGLVLKPRPVHKGKDYICYDVGIALIAGGKQTHHKIHRLVGQAFIPNPENKPEIDHIDRNPANNKVENLRWATSSEQKYNSKTRTDNKLGEKCIHMVNGRVSPYKVCGTRMPTRFFKTLEEAVAYRNTFISNE